MINFTGMGLTFDDPTTKIIMLNSVSMGIHMFYLDSQVEDALVFLRENESEINWIFMGEAGDYLRIPTPGNRNGNEWIGYYTLGNAGGDIAGTNIVSMMEEIPLGADSFLVYRS